MKRIEEVGHYCLVFACILSSMDFTLTVLIFTLTIHREVEIYSKYKIARELTHMLGPPLRAFRWMR